MQTPQKSPSLRPFKQRKSLATRREEVAGIRVKFPGKIPVIVERYPREKFLPRLDKTKFLVPQELTMTQFLSVIRFMGCFQDLLNQNLWDGVHFQQDSPRSRMVLGATEAFYLLVNNKSLGSMNVTMAEIYRDYKDEDGFVYMTYASQEMFGCLGSAGPEDGSSFGEDRPCHPL
ncbi:microtubule-associated proteins 1A/1B light chain 3C isoform X1 [Cervus elaphus]|uniref:microtubule-associated proteins 1A/1B light chain 3C isoform X1 n=1 Tax=Cervus canadensis TaxID=1574408 RepID=UPI0018BC7D2C|nr:microtubule-associated proteins 1A/1B light chain 3C isoform X1 [Cervus canadensis]XP_043780345.1 microtubule-associated proteins 1A/1B light chain 3C isoform X1 [Cervus elaphus]